MKNCTSHNCKYKLMHCINVLPLLHVLYNLGSIYDSQRAHAILRTYFVQKIVQIHVRSCVFSLTSQVLNKGRKYNSLLNFFGD